MCVLLDQIKYFQTTFNIDDVTTIPLGYVKYGLVCIRECF